MKNSKIWVGLDIGTTKIVALVGKKNEYDKVEILGYGKSKSQGVHRGVVNNITQTIQSIKIAVDEAQSKSGIELKEVAVGIAGQHIRSLQHSDYITRENPDEVINENDIDKLKNLDLWIVGLLRYDPHPSHAGFDQVLDYIKYLKPKKTILTNLHSDLDYSFLIKTLQKNVVPAYDGLEINLWKY